LVVWPLTVRLVRRVEVKNLAFPGNRRTREQERQYRRLRAKLAQVERTRLQPLG
jgi:hypothetical protein